jgi:hypothetical protein
MARPGIELDDASTGAHAFYPPGRPPVLERRSPTVLTEEIPGCVAYSPLEAGVPEDLSLWDVGP